MYLLDEEGNQDESLESKTLSAEDQVKDHSAGTRVVAGQIFLESGKSDSQSENEENFHSREEEKENSLEELNSLEMSNLLNKDLEEAEIQSPGNCSQTFEQVTTSMHLSNSSMWGTQTVILNIWNN